MFSNKYIVIIMIVLASGKAHAYLDMGTGSYIIQLILAGVFTSIYFFKLYWFKLVSFFSKIFKRNKIN